jgi:phosphatidylinositol 4-kinase
MRLILTTANLLQVLARWFACQRQLRGGEGGALQIVGGSGLFGRRVYQVHTPESQHLAEHARREARLLADALHSDELADAADWERALPQITTALLDHAPKISSAHQQLLTYALRDALLKRIGRNPELGLRCCWLLQDALLDETTTTSAFGDGLFRVAWAASQQSEECGETAAFVGALVRLSERLAKVERTKRRQPERLWPLLHALNEWLAPRALRGGVAVPLLPASSASTLKVLRLDVERCRVMPSRARAPTLLYCEALVEPSDDDAASDLNLDAEARRWADVVAPPTTPSYDVVESFSNSPSRTAFEAARRSELLRRVYPDGAWETFEERCRSQSPYGQVPGWRLASFLVKADDELRREGLAMQVVDGMRKTFRKHGVDAYLRPYGITCCGARAGLVETMADTHSIDHVKQAMTTLDLQPDLSTYFDIVYGPYDDRLTGDTSRKEASLNFARSLAGASLLCYALDVKDRHNGNIMLDRAGRLVHIDFGYMLGRTPGGLNFEDSPFKLPDEYVRVLGGVGSDAWVAFSTALAGGLHALAADLHELQTTLALFFGDAPFGADAARKLGDRFADLDGDPRRTVVIATEMIRQSHNSERAKQYDWYQWRTNGIVP